MFIRGTVPGNAWFICRCLIVARCRKIPGLFADVYSWHGVGKYLVYLQMFIRGTVPENTWFNYLQMCIRGTVSGNTWFICRCLFVARCREIPGLFADVYSWHGIGKYLVYLQMFKSIFTARQRSWAKVMFSQVFVYPQGWGWVCLVPGPFWGYVQGVGVSWGGVGLSKGWIPTPCYWHLVTATTFRPPSGRYASYWNTFLFSIVRIALTIYQA